MLRDLVLLRSMKSPPAGADEGPPDNSALLVRSPGFCKSFACLAQRTVPEQRPDLCVAAATEFGNSRMETQFFRALFKCMVEPHFSR